MIGMVVIIASFLVVICSGFTWYMRYKMLKFVGEEHFGDDTMVRYATWITLVSMIVLIVGVILYTKGI